MLVSSNLEFIVLNREDYKDSHEIVWSLVSNLSGPMEYLAYLVGKLSVVIRGTLDCVTRQI